MITNDIILTSYFEVFENQKNTQKFDQQTKSQSDIHKKIIDDEFNKIYFPKHKAQCLIAHYYRKKYNIEIFPLSDWSDLRQLIEKLRQYENVKVGFLLPCVAGDKVCHHVPVVYEKNGDNEALISFDALGYGKPAIYQKEFDRNKGEWVMKLSSPEFTADTFYEHINFNNPKAMPVYANGQYDLATFL